MPVRKIKQCIFVWSIMDCEVNNMHSGKKNWYLIPKGAKFWHSKGGGKFLSAIFSNNLGSQDGLKYECCIYTTRERVAVPRGLWFELVDLPCASHLERWYQGAKRVWDSLGAGEPGEIPWELAGQSVRAWDPPHHPSKGAGQPWGQPGQTSILQHLWGRDWWPQAGLEWGSVSLGQAVVWGMESLDLGIPVSYLKVFPELLWARVMR